MCFHIDEDRLKEHLNREVEREKFRAAFAPSADKRSQRRIRPLRELRIEAREKVE